MLGEKEPQLTAGKRRQRIALGSVAAGIFAVVTTVLAVVQISQDVETIGSASDSPSEVVVVDSKSEISIFEVLSARGDCFLSAVNFFDGEKPSPISEAKWRAEDRTLDVEFLYTCLHEGFTLELSIRNLEQSDPGSIQVSGLSREAMPGILSMTLALQDWKGEVCSAKSISLDSAAGSGGSYFNGDFLELFEPSPGCELIWPSQFVHLKSGMAIDKEKSIAIYELLRDRAPSGCFFIGAPVDPFGAYGKGEDAPTILYLADNYPIFGLWDLPTASENTYEFDESLATKIDYAPIWTYYCAEGNDEVSELSVGGFVSSDSGDQTRRPNVGEVPLRFTLRGDELYDADIKFEFFDSELKSCGSWAHKISFEDESSAFFAYSEVVISERVRYARCPIAALTGFEKRLRGKS